METMRYTLMPSPVGTLLLAGKAAPSRSSALARTAQRVVQTPIGCAVTARSRWPKRS